MEQRFLWPFAKVVEWALRHTRGASNSHDEVTLNLARRVMPDFEGCVTSDDSSATLAP